MRILYFSQYFPPEVGATQTRAFEMSRYLASRGHHVTVITEVPNHPSGIIPPHYRGRLSERKTEHGVDVLRLWVSTSPEKTFRTRMKFYLSYMGMAALAGSLIRESYDLVYATSPPLFVGAAGIAVAAVRRIPFVFEVRDLWPESAVALGELSSSKAIKAAQLLEGLLYRRAANVVAVTSGIRERLFARGLPPEKVALITNGANTEQFKFDPEGARQLAGKLELQGKFVAMYAGVHGVAQGLETLLQAARLLQYRDEIAFVFVGEGPRKAHVVQITAEMGLPNVRYLPEVPSEQMPAYLSLAGCAIVPLKDEPIFRGALPSKMFEAWSCGCPVVLSVAGEAEALLKQAGAGIAVPPEDPAALARAIEALQTNRAQAKAMGRRGRAFVEQRYSRHLQARKLEKLMLQIGKKK